VVGVHFFLRKMQERKNTKRKRFYIMIDVTALEGRNYAGLHDAVLANNLEASKALLGLGVNPDELDSHGFAPLHYAVMKDNVEIAKALLDSGARVDIPSEQCTNPRCAEAMRCILLQKATGDSSSLDTPDVLKDYDDFSN
jgi:ankyrin repeat protein